MGKIYRPCLSLAGIISLIPDKSIIDEDWGSPVIDRDRSGQKDMVTMPTIQKISHIAIAVDDIDKALHFWRNALGLSLSGIRDVPQEKSQVAFLPVGGSEIELVRPTADDSGLARFLAKRGPGMHHICLEVDDLDAMLAQLKEKGIRLINASPLTAVDGKHYAFIHPESTGGVLVELYQV